MPSRYGFPEWYGFPEKLSLQTRRQVPFQQKETLIARKGSLITDLPRVGLPAVELQCARVGWPGDRIILAGHDGRHRSGGTVDLPQAPLILEVGG